MTHAPPAAPSGTTRADAQARDADDPLRPLRALFDLPPGVIYLDGNSLGVLPRATAARVEAAIRGEWGTGLIRSWNDAGWIDLPRRVGDKIARLVGAGPGELTVADSTSVNLYKVLAGALRIQRQADPARRAIVSETGNFPTDLYIAQSLAAQHGGDLRLVEPDDIAAALTPDVAVLMLTHVNYRSGRMHDLAALSRAAHAAGALVVWDLAHSAGAVPVTLKADDAAASADFAVGCGYKYLNGGPGAPAFLWVHPRHAADFEQPLSGWMGHAAPFAFVPGYLPAPGVARALCGTPPVLPMTALECGVDTVLAAEPLGGMAALRAKSLALTQAFIDGVASRCAGHGLVLCSPADGAQRGSQASYRFAGDGYALMQALISRGVIGDFRAGGGATASTADDLLRFGFTPLYLGFTEVWDAVETLRSLLDSGEWRDPRHARRAAVT